MMRIQTILCILFVTITFTNCKNEKSIDSLELVKPVLVDNSFKVTLSLIVEKDDTFSLYYTTDGTSIFGNIAPIWKEVRGDKNEQLISYTLPLNSYPSQLRLDFGIEKNQETILLKSVGLEYKESKRIIVGAELGKFFRADDSKCTFNPSTGEIKAIVKDGVRQLPSLYPHETTLQPEIMKLIKEKNDNYSP